MILTEKGHRVIRGSISRRIRKTEARGVFNIQSDTSSISRKPSFMQLEFQSL
jgi:hypothetical protein